jgi:hypothetical protein
MVTFKDLKFETINDGFMLGKKSRIHFDNGYGASVVCHNFSYGGKTGLYELAVLDQEGEICYNTPITSDTLGWLKEDDVTEALQRIEALKMKKYRYTFMAEVIFDAEDETHAEEIFARMDLGNVQYEKMILREQL